MYILLSVVLAAILCVCIIYPLWIFAMVTSQVYTFLTLLLIFAFLIFKFVRNLIRQYKTYNTDEDRKKFFLRLIFKFLQLIVIIAAICISVLLVLKENRIAALIILLAGIGTGVFLSKYKKRFSDV